MSEISRAEVEGHFFRWREALDSRDYPVLRSLLTEDARGGNSVYGVVEDREAIVDFMRESWPLSVPNVSVWHAIDGARLVHKWRETLPGKPPADRDYHYYGISEFIYAGEGRWNFMYGLPDVVGLARTYAAWGQDGHSETYGEVYPGMAR